MSFHLFSPSMLFELCKITPFARPLFRLLEYHLTAYHLSPVFKIAAAAAAAAAAATACHGIAHEKCFFRCLFV